MNRANDVCFRWRGVYVDFIRRETENTWAVLIDNVVFIEGIATKRLACVWFCNYANQNSEAAGALLHRPSFERVS